MTKRSKIRSVRVFGLALLVLAGIWSCKAGAQTFSDFTIPTGASIPTGIIAGPDGALWFTESSTNKIGRVTTSGSFTEYPVPTASSSPLAIVNGPDGALWFVESTANKIGRITTSGAITEFQVPGLGQDLAGIAAGPDGALWFTNAGNNTIGRVTTAGVFTSFPLPQLETTGTPGGIVAGSDGALWFTNQNGQIDRVTTSGSFSAFFTSQAGPVGIAAGPDGALWYTYLGIPKVGRVTTSGTVTEFSVSQAAFTMVGIAAGPDGAMWFSEGNGNVIGRLTTAGALSEYQIPSSIAEPLYITPGPDGAMWFTVQAGSNFGSIGRITVPATATTSLVAAVLPASRSAVVNNAVTAFATIINSGSAAASGCAIAPVTPVPASFLYQTTNPATNALTGSPNTPANIAAGQPQSFVIAFTASAPFTPTNVVLGFDCANVPAAASVLGLNTLLLSGSATPVPDIVALAATATNDGILHITGSTGTAAFAVATVDVGTSGAITVTADTGSATLPLGLTLCQTTPSTGQCLAAPSTSVSTTINANATPTFGIFGQASGSIAFAPAASRIFVRFVDSGGITRGSTSVAVQTQ
jgi:virginiamycin B lyase